jgi:phosphohistidine phosphatase
MQLYLLRHAEAEDSSPTGDDTDRRLTDAGAKRMKAVARGIASLGPRFDAVLVSPLVRARQTAEPVAAACGFSREFRETDALLPHASPDDLLRELSRLKCESALLVGHQPHMGRLFGRLLAGEGGLEVPMRKASLAVVETAADISESGELRLYLTARVLERLA